jgi:mono/diheme cytochrome c family protein
MRVALNIVLFLAVIALAAANFALRPNPSRLNYEFLPQMAHAPRYGAFAPSPNFADGKTLQAPPQGAIPRGYTPLHYAATPQDAVRAGEELKSPVDLTSQQARERGSVVFANYCAVCHGPGGSGNGTVTQRGFPPPPSLLADHALKMKDGQIFHVLTFGQNNMPSYGSQLSREDRWNVIACVRTLQAQVPAAPSASPKVAAKPKLETQHAASLQPISPAVASAGGQQ